MKFIYPHVELLPQPVGEDGIYKQIETAARTCYKSEGNKGKEFVDKLIENKHTAMLEHGTVHLMIVIGNSFQDENFIEKIDLYHKFLNSPYSRIKIINYRTLDYKTPDYLIEYANKYSEFTVYYITTNLRVLLENFHNYEEILNKYLCFPTEHIPRYSVRITCDRGVSHELVRHRKFSFAQESTRYCNYSKDKFGNEITYIIPTWINDFEKYVKNYGIPCEGVIIRPHTDDVEMMKRYNFFYSLFYSEENYFRLLDLGCTPQEARQVLPNALKTEIVMTGFIDDWKYFLDVRTTNTYGVPHPDMRNVALMIEDTLSL